MNPSNMAAHCGSPVFCRPFIVPSVQSAEFIIADAGSDAIAALLAGADAAALSLGRSSSVRQVLESITRALPGRRLDVLHLVAHGSARGVFLGGQWLDADALRAAPDLLAQWQVGTVALWSCEAGQNQDLIATLAHMTGATVCASVRALGMLDGAPNWVLESCAGGNADAAAAKVHAPRAPFAAAVMAT